MKNVDITNCDKEPIHLINEIQSHGALLIVEPSTKKITGVSENIENFVDSPSVEIMGLTLAELFGEDLEQSVLDNPVEHKQFLELPLKQKDGVAIHHTNGTHIILELEYKNMGENVFEHQMQLSQIFTKLNQSVDVDDLCQNATHLVKKFTGYDRVMIYRFDHHWNGEVIAESKEDRLESWLGLHYPASDIPKQARALFLKQGVRIISDVYGDNKKVLMKHESEVDFTNSELRAASPIHIEYLKNMKVGATLTAAIVYNDALWGLIACHNYSPSFIDYYKRASVKFLTQVFSTQLGLRSTNVNLEKINYSNKIRAKVLEKLSSDWNIMEGLRKNAPDLQAITESDGFIAYFDGTYIAHENVPVEEATIKLLHQIRKKTDATLFVSDSLMEDLPTITEIPDAIAGMLCIFMSSEQRDALLWFKNEITQEVSWGGNPEKSVVDEDGRLSPRKSFEKWKQLKKGCSKPWMDYEIASAKAMREHISEIILNKYEEILELNQKLKTVNNELESFSYSVSHDLRAPLRGISGFSQILTEKYYDVLDDFGKDALHVISDSTKKMNSLIDDILSFSGLGKKNAELSTFDMTRLVQEVLDYLKPDNHYMNSKIEIVDELGPAVGDRAMLFQLLNNLIGNALKYSSKSDGPQVRIGKKNNAYYVKDNGIGFDMKHKDQIFGVFKRLVNDEFEGSGIGLAISRRVVEKHNGKIWAESEIGKGSTFYFTLNGHKFHD